MADEQVNAVLRQSLNLSLATIKKEHPDWSTLATNDYLYKQNNINSMADLSDDQTDQIVINTDNISTNAQGISDNADAIGDNTTAIGDNADNLTDHENLTTAHGVTGVNVGTLDFATAGTGGVVNLAAAVVDAVASVVSVDSPDATDLPTVITLSNEMKGDVNQVVTDLNNSLTQLNILLANMRTANQLTP